MESHVAKSLLVWCAACLLGTEGEVKVSLRNAAGPEVRASNDVGPTKVTTSGRQLLVNGQPFFIKGVCWNPIPIGGNHPEGLDWAGMVEADGDLMKSAGINAVRTYEGITDLAVLDKLYERGIYVVNNVYGYYALPLDDIRRVVEATKHHPAILMWSVGNEWNYNNLYSQDKGDAKLSYLETRQRLMDAIALIKQLDPDHLVTTVYGELPFKAKKVLESTGDSYYVMKEVDVWAINVYRGHEYLDAEGFTLFESWERGSRKDPKPMFIGEYGSDAFDARIKAPNYSAQAFATKNLAQGILDEAFQTGGTVSGGFIFEFADEWWKDGSGLWDVHDDGGSAPGGGPYPDRTFNEEWFGLLSIKRESRLAWEAYKAIPAYPESKGWTADLSILAGFAVVSVSLHFLSAVGHR